VGAELTSSPDGTVRTLDDGRHEFRFERTLAYPVERVWAALTEPEQMVGWWAQAELDLQEGGAVVLRWLNHDDEGNQAVLEGRVTELGHPRAFEIEGEPHGVLRFELCPEENSTHLTFSAVVAAPDEVVPMALAGWHVHLDHLADFLAGEPVDWQRWDEQHRPAWREHHERYLAASAV
jgi:uncharacterized protein YndB with AHSA1/START domain